MSRAGDAHYQIRRLISSPSAAYVAAHHRWGNEEERWTELAASMLSVTLKLPRDEIADVVYRMKMLGLLDVAAWSELPGDFNAASESVMVERALAMFDEHEGVATKDAYRAVRLLHETAQAIQLRYGGRIQIALRKAGELVLDKISKELDLKSISASEERAALTIWLQNVLNLPISLGSQNRQDFCDHHSISTEELTEAADELDLTIPALDDLIEYWAHEESEKAARMPPHAEAAER
jgi:hypothetical protein